MTNQTFLAQASYFPAVWFLLALPVTWVILTGWEDQKWAHKTAYALLGLVLGAGRLTLAQTSITDDHIAFYNNIGTVTVVGVVRGEPDRRSYQTNLRVDVESVTFPNGDTREVHGLILVKAPPYDEAQYGDRIQATGTLEQPPVFQDFSYRDYLARQNIHALLLNADVATLAQHQGSLFWEYVYRFKAYSLKTLLALFPEPEASLLAGILLGVETGIPDDVNDDFVATGTSHIIAISGFNLSIIATFFVKTAGKLMRKHSEVWVALGGIWLYTLFVGASPAVMRAAVMATVSIIANRKVRVGKIHGPTSLASAAWVMMLLNPYVLWDVGFQLSIAATLGLILYTEPLTLGFERFLGRFMRPEHVSRITGWLSEAFIVTIAAQITTSALIVGVFRRFSLATLLTNLLILPVQNYVMLVGGLSLIVGLIAYPLGQLLAWPAWAFLWYTLAAVRWTATFPMASVELSDVTLPMVWGYYGILFAATWWFNQPAETRKSIRAKGLDLIFRKEVAIGAAAIFAFLVYLYMIPDGRLHVSFLDAGLGDAIFVQTPGGKQILIDGGPDAARTLSELGRAMPFWDRRLDMVILTSPDDERMGGLTPVLERYEVDFVSAGAEVGEGSVYERWQELVMARSPDTRGTLWAGMDWQLDEDVALHVLWPPPGEIGPLVLRLSHGEISVLLMGDATTLVEEALVARDGKALHSTVLLLARHGVKTSTTTPFLQAVTPEAAIITLGDDERYPSPAVLARLIDTPIYRTDQHSTIEIVSDGRTIRVKTERDRK